jgi:cell division septation protein DedD
LVALKKPTVVLLLLLTGCAGSKPGGSAASQSPGASLGGEEAGAAPSVALRLPARGGPVRLYRLPSLEPADWVSSGPAARPSTAIAMDAAGNRLLYRDRTGAIDAFDLVASQQQSLTPRGRWFAALTTDTLLAVSDKGEVVESEPWATQPWPTAVGGDVLDAFAGIGSRLLVIRHDSLALATREAGVSQEVPAPTSTVRTASRNGDAVAYVTDSGVVVLEERDQWRPWFVRLTGGPVDVAFSPSGHQLYVALHEKSELGVVDRFLRKERPAIPLPGPAGGLRMDPWGRAVLVRPYFGGDASQTWVVGIATGRLTGRIGTRWASDLPAVSQDGVLLTREESAVVARDIHSLDSLGAVAGGAPDLWFVGRWRPVSPGASARQQARAAQVPAPSPAPQVPAPRRRDTTAVSRPAAPPPPAAAPRQAPRATAFWIQFAVLQNESRARDFADQLTVEGHAAVVANPAQPGEGWRILLGPYPTHASADSAARLVGRPYWVTVRGPTSSR